MKYGFIGLGNMAKAIIRGMTANRFDAADICAIAKHTDRATETGRVLGINVCATLAELVSKSDVLVLAIKPQVLPEVLPELKKQLTDEKLIVSIAAGKDIAYLKSCLGDNMPIIRVMPNINAKVGYSTSGMCACKCATQQQLELVKALFETVGSVTQIPETLFPVFSAVAGASVAFTYMYIDALARAAVREGMPKAMALEVAASSVLGSAKLIQGSNEHPMSLVDQVCSPGGTTIEGVCVLRERGFEAAVHKAVDAVTQKDIKLSK
ncbi:MAG: pyrroline-5-carboxylate reductase [Clostridia bacterium]